MVAKTGNKITFYNKPSIIAQIISGLLTAYCIYLFYTNKTFNEWERLIALIGISISVGIHGISHLFMEIHYNLNPLETIKKY